MFINVAGKLLNFREPKIMGIINLTPDSFYSASRKSLNNCLQTVEKFIQLGCDIIDIGGYSSRPDAINISLEQEWGRLERPLALIRKTFPEVIISIDTFRAQVASNALDSGANIINDISGGGLDSQMYRIIERYRVPYILMHMKGAPQNMQHFTCYGELPYDIMSYFTKKLEILHQHNVKDVIIDPGFGFAKTMEQNYSLLHHLDLLKIFDLPILVGISRKSMVYKVLDIEPSEAIIGTSILNFLSILKGANILRVHDIEEAQQVCTLWSFYKQVNKQ